MRANELIPYGLYKKGKSIVRITAIDIVADACRGVDISNGEDTGWFPSDKLSPIPLTAEILKKNRFVYIREFDRYIKNDGDDYYIKVGLHPFKNTFGIGYKSNYIAEKESYVHELQHALRLCGLNELADSLEL